MKKKICSALLVGALMIIMYNVASQEKSVWCVAPVFSGECMEYAQGMQQKISLGTESVDDKAELVKSELLTASARNDLSGMALGLGTNGQGADGLMEEENEYANLAIMNVDDYVNVRNAPSTDGDIVGKIYPHAVAQVLGRAGENDEWFQIVSGNVEGYMKAEFFLYGDEAAEEIEKYVQHSITVNADRLNVRKEPDTASSKIGYLNRNEKADILEKGIEENGTEWVKITYGNDKEGYVAKEYVTISEDFIYAKSLEEERAEREAAVAQAAREQEAVQNDILGEIVFPADNYASNEELRKGIVDYAMQFLGNVYINGGQSLVTGTDCSGFTCYIYKDFGYSISRTPGGQYANDGRSISFEEIQPGDIICYGKSKCTHVALYIGGGQIIHAANSRKGVVIYEADYDNILAIKNIID